MEKCNSCGHSLTLKEKYRLMWRTQMNNESKCPHCGSVYYLSSRTMLANHLFLLIGYLVLMAVINLTHIGGLGFLAGMLILFCGWLTFLPFTVKVVEEQDCVLDRQFKAMNKTKEETR